MFEAGMHICFRQGTEYPQLWDDLTEEEKEFVRDLYRSTREERARRASGAGGLVDDSFAAAYTAP